MNVHQKQRDLVVLGDDWGRHQSSSQHLVRRLAASRQVIWMNSIGMRSPKLSLNDFQRMVEKARSMVGGSKAAPKVQTSVEQPETLSILSPKALPFPGNPLANAVNRRVLSSQLKKEMLARNVSKPILWLSLPNAEFLSDALDEHKLVYYCGDDFGAWQGVDHKPILKSEAKLVEKADLIIASSEHLMEKFPAKKSILVEHGVDHSAFASDVKRAADMPEGPVAGFFGTIGSRIFTEAIAKAATDLPNWNFVMIGPVQTDVSALQSLSNVHFLGPCKFSELGSYVQHWDVSLMPMRPGPDMDASNPLKLREYFAAGSPIAAIRFKAVKRYEHLMHVCNDEGEFTKAILTATEDSDRNEERRAFVAAESWEAQAAKVDAALGAL